MTPVVDNPARHRFELDEGGQVAFADYQRSGGRLVIPHVEAPQALRGTGAAGRLMEGVLESRARRSCRSSPCAATPRPTSVAIASITTC